MSVCLSVFLSTQQVQLCSYVHNTFTQLGNLASQSQSQKSVGSIDGVYGLSGGPRDKGALKSALQEGSDGPDPGPGDSDGRGRLALETLERGIASLRGLARTPSSAQDGVRLVS